MRGSGDSETKDLKESRPFSPLPSTSDDHYTFALNDSLFSSHFEESRREGLEPESDRREQPAPEPEPEPHTEPSPPVVQGASADVIDIIAVRTPSPHIEIVDSPSAPTNGSPNPSNSDMALKIEPTEITTDLDVESDSSDCEIVSVVNGNPEPDSYTILESPQPSVPAFSSSDDSKNEAYPPSPRSCLYRRKRPRRTVQNTLNPYSMSSVLGEDNYSHRSVRRPRSTAIAFLTMTEIIRCVERTSSEFVHSDPEPVESLEDRNGPLRIIDTVDLSVDTFKPTPIINEIIVVDSDTSVNVDGGCSVSSAGSSTPNNRTNFSSSVPEKNCDNSPGAPRLRDCPICLDSFSSSKPVASTFCGHIFCSHCVETVMKTSRKCPTCRKKLSGKGYHFLFF